MMRTLLSSPTTAEEITIQMKRENFPIEQSSVTWNLDISTIIFPIIQSPLSSRGQMQNFRTNQQFSIISHGGYLFPSTDVGECLQSSRDTNMLILKNRITKLSIYSFVNLNITITTIFVNNKYSISSNITYFLAFATEKELKGKNAMFCGKCQLSTRLHSLINSIFRNLWKFEINLYK